MPGEDTRLTQIQERTGRVGSDEAESAGDEYHSEIMANGSREVLDESDTRLACPSTSRLTVPDPLGALVMSITVAGAGGPDHLRLPGPRLQLMLRDGPAPGDVEAYLAGARARVHRKQAPQRRTVIIRFHPRAARLLTGSPLSALTERIVPVAEVWNADASSRLEEALRCSDPAHWAREACRALSSRLAHADAPPDRQNVVVRKAARLFTRRAGITVAEVATRLGYSERQLRRLVRATTGLSPKQLTRTQRLHRALRLARGVAVDGWSGVAVAAGYYDQAHMHREFRDLAGATPRQLLAELAETEATAAEDHDIRSMAVRRTW